MEKNKKTSGFHHHLKQKTTRYSLSDIRTVFWVILSLHENGAVTTYRPLRRVLYDAYICPFFSGFSFTVHAWVRASQYASVISMTSRFRIHPVESVLKSNCLHVLFKSCCRNLHFRGRNGMCGCVYWLLTLYCLPRINLCIPHAAPPCSHGWALSWSLDYGEQSLE